MTYHDFTRFPVWQKASTLLVHVYDATNEFPIEERYAMTSNIRRAANSVIHNIAEGYGRFERKDKSRFYKISRGSAYEVISQTMTSHLLQYIHDQSRDVLVEGYKEIIGELDKLIKTIESQKSR